MLAVVKKHRTKKTLFEVNGDVPSDIIDYLKNKYGQDIKVIEGNETLENIFGTKWYKDIRTSIAPGDTVKMYRENAGFSSS